MAETKKLTVAKVERFGESIVLPTGMTYKQAIDTLMRQSEYENEVVQFNYEFNYFPWDGAYALAQVTQKRYGFVFGKTEWSFFGPQRPQLIGIETGYGKVEQVAWGSFTLPAIGGGKLSTGMKAKAGGRLIFTLQVTAKRGFAEEIETLQKEVQKFLDTGSIYRGKAVSVRFKDDDGEPILNPETGEVPAPNFLDLSKDRSKQLVLPKHVQDAVETSLYTPIERMKEVREAGMSNNRGVLLTGDFGTGKTLIAYVAAKKATDNGVTYVYCQNPKEFPEIMRFAAQYSPALVFCEDVDRIVPGGERTYEIDNLINVIDGVDTKNHQIVTVFTTNDVKNINKALLRPGRMDAVIHVERPDAEAAIRLVHNYIGAYLPAGADLTGVGELLADKIPAVIEEVCSRSKLAALKRTPRGQALTEIPVEALHESALSMKKQLDLLYATEPQPESDALKGMKHIALSLQGIANSFDKGFDNHVPAPEPKDGTWKGKGTLSTRKNHELAD